MSFLPLSTQRNSSNDCHSSFVSLSSSSQHHRQASEQRHQESQSQCLFIHIFRAGAISPIAVRPYSAARIKVRWIWHACVYVCTYVHVRYCPCMHARGDEVIQRISGLALLIVPSNRESGNRESWYHKTFWWFKVRGPSKHNRAGGLVEA